MNLSCIYLLDLFPCDALIFETTVTKLQQYIARELSWAKYNTASTYFIFNAFYIGLQAHSFSENNSRHRIAPYIVLLIAKAAPSVLKVTGSLVINKLNCFNITLVSASLYWLTIGDKMTHLNYQDMNGWVPDYHKEHFCHVFLLTVGNCVPRTNC